MNTDPKLNLLLEALPDSTRARLLPHLKLVDLQLGTIIYEPDIALKQVYFPLPGCIAAGLYYFHALRYGRWFLSRNRCVG